MRKIKHTKFKNTGILFETLSKQVVSDVLSGNKQISLQIIKKYFNEHTELSKELACYNILLETVGKKPESAIKLYDMVSETRKSLDTKKLNAEKYKLISELQHRYNINELFSTRVRNYKLFASVYKLFEYNEENSPTEYISSYETIIEHMSNSSKQTIPDTIYTEYSKLDEDIKTLTYKLIFEKFNKKYKDFSIKQRVLLSKYISENTALTNFKKFMINEADTVKETLGRYVINIPDTTMKIKLKECMNLLGEISTAKTIKDKHVSSMLKYYQLVDELNNITKGDA